VTPRISLIIPARNEEDYLPRLLDSITVARARYHRGPDAVEVIVADNASTDHTAAIARAAGCVVAHVEKRAIAAARNGGAATARGEILCFTDADNRLHPESFNVIDSSISDARTMAGATGMTLERWSLPLAMTYVMIMPMIWTMNIDTGVVFCRREDFAAVGGYNEDLRVSEDVRFLMDLRRLGKSRAQRLRRPRGAKCIGSVRKFDRYGDCHALLTLPRLLWWTLRCGGSPKRFFAHPPSARFIDEYWYGDVR